MRVFRSYLQAAALPMTLLWLSALSCSGQTRADSAVSVRHTEGAAPVPSDPGAPKLKGAPKEPGSYAISKLQFRDRQLTVTSTRQGIRYTVHEDDGRVVADLTLAELDAYDTLLSNTVRSATANRTYVDARLDPHVGYQNDQGQNAGRLRRAIGYESH